MSYRQASQTYRQIGTQTSVEAASPHRLIQMLMEGGLQAIARAKGHLLHQDVAEKGTELSRAISIIEGLRVSLDKTQGGGDRLESGGALPVHAGTPAAGQPAQPDRTPG